MFGHSRLKASVFTSLMCILGTFQLLPFDDTAPAETLSASDRLLCISLTCIVTQPTDQPTNQPSAVAIDL
jgi:hypothetical protein